LQPNSLLQTKRVSKFVGDRLPEPHKNSIHYLSGLPLVVLNPTLSLSLKKHWFQAAFSLMVKFCQKVKFKNPNEF
jgi:hypothetical protein